MSVVQIKPIDEKKWHGKKGSESFTQPKAIEALYDDETGGLATGLSVEEQVEYTKKIGTDLTPIFSPEIPHPFYGSKAGWLKLENHPMFLNTDKPIDYVKIALAKANKMVANSITEYNEGMWPEATHVIYDESEEVQAKATKIDMRRKCNSIDDKMSDEDRINLVQIINGKSLKGRSKNFITVEIEDIIQTKPAEFLKYTSMGKDKVYIMASVKEAIHRNILTKEGGSVFYMGDMIGLDEIGAVEWFSDPQNQKMRLSIFDKLIY